MQVGVILNALDEKRAIDGRREEAPVQMVSFAWVFAAAVQDVSFLNTHVHGEESAARDLLARPDFPGVAVLPDLIALIVGVRRRAKELFFECQATRDTDNGIDPFFHRVTSGAGAARLRATATHCQVL